MIPTIQIHSVATITIPKEQWPSVRWLLQQLHGERRRAHGHTFATTVAKMTESPERWRECYQSLRVFHREVAVLFWNLNAIVRDGVNSEVIFQCGEGVE